MALSLELPTIQNWSCHNCAGCCRQHLIEITDAERDRIQRQGWQGSGELGGREPIVPLSWSRRRWRLNHTDDGACVFLQEDGLCRIHAKFGETAKPLACRVYPYAFHPAANGKIAVSLRYSCPSVIKNAGQTAHEAAPAIRAIAKEVVTIETKDLSPPAISPHTTLDWKSVRRVTAHLAESIRRDDLPLSRTLLETIFWVTLLDQGQLKSFDAARVDEFLNLIRPAASAEVPADLTEFDPPSRPGHIIFRTILGQYVRLETTADLNHPWRSRWRNVRGLARISGGKGLTPHLRDELPPVPFDAIEHPLPGPESGNELFRRFLLTKIEGMHFCGLGFYDMPVTTGFFALALVIPITLYMARWLALADNRTSLTLQDIQRALAMADHHHGYSPGLGGSLAERRIRTLAKGDLAKLCVWYFRKPPAAAVTP